MKVQEIMTSDVLTIGPEAELRDVARIFVERGISGLPVCGARREILGVVSEGDILFKEQGPRGQSMLSRLGGKALKELEKTRAVKVSEAMTTPAITVSPYCSVAEAARLMSEHGINRLPVVKGAELVGIVTRTDLVRAFVRSDEEIRREIGEDLIRRTLWIEAPEAIGVDIERGAVRLSGHLQTSSDASLLVRLVARVPGVVSVESDLSWTTDDMSRDGRRELRRTQVPASSR
ncbi:MAG: CBS domain-containing protein [Gaiellaceae bacterium]